MENDKPFGSASFGYAGVVGFIFLMDLVLMLPQRAFSQDQGTPPAPPRDLSVETSRNQLTFQERADIHMARKEFADAVDDYLSALKTQTDGQAGVWNKLGIAYQQQDKFDRARDSYKKALHFDKDFAEAWNNLGTTYFLQDKAKKSVKYYQHAIRLKTDVASFHMNLGTAYYRTKKYEPAVNEYCAALTLDPAILREHSAQGTVVDARAGGEKQFYYLAKAFAKLGRAEEAIRYLRRAFEEGFHDREQLGKDPDFQKISSNPAFVELLNHPPVPIKD